MSKKKKKKFNAQLAQALIQTQNKAELSDTTITNNPEQNKKQEANKQTSVIESDEQDKKLAKTVYHEIKTIAGAMIVCMVILLGIWALGLKTPYVNNFSNWLTTALHIGNN